MPPEIDKSIGNEKTCAPASGSGGSAIGQTLEPGHILGQYKVIRVLGRGGMGEVYLCEHAILTTKHAVKLLPAERSASTGFIQRFHDEARVMAKLDHPGIVKVTHADEQSKRHYLVMDFIGADATDEPFDLEDAIAAASDNRLPPEIVARLGMRIAEAVGAAHAAGVVHRDLKPANVLLTSRDLSKADVRVADFGLARLLGEDWLFSRVDSSMRQSMSIAAQPTLFRQGYAGQALARPHAERDSTGAILGTYEYMSPEQRDGEEPDTKSDIYGLGVMLYRMVTGRRLMGMAKPPSRVVKGLDTTWDDLVSACLEELPEDRPENMEAVVNRLQGFCSKLQSCIRIESERKEHENLKAGDKSKIDLGGGVQLDLVWIPPGTFMMGSTRAEQDAAAAGETQHSYNWEAPQHQVTLSKGFWMGKYTVTLEQWQRVMGNNPNHFNEPKNPADSVSWYDCEDFMQALNTILKTRNPVLGTARLPTEAEWEYACRAGTTTAFHYGNDLDASMANFEDYEKGVCPERTFPVGSFRPNAWGLHDMHGNVWEWCEDWFGPYTSDTVTDPTGLWLDERTKYDTISQHLAYIWLNKRAGLSCCQDDILLELAGSNRVLRGGSFFHYARDCRSAARGMSDPTERNKVDGFRVVVSEQNDKQEGVYNSTQIQESSALIQNSGPLADEQWKSPSTGMEFVWVEELKLWVGKFEVTNAEYRRKQPKHNSGASQGHSLNGSRQPVVYVNFDDAKAYAEWLTLQDAAVLNGARYRLPSEQEWETFARCGDNREYPWGNNWPPCRGEAGNYADETAKLGFEHWTVIFGYYDGFVVTAPVDKLWANPWGLHGVGGNVWEACVSDSYGVSFGAWRGASWRNDGQDILRVSYRRVYDRSIHSNRHGFRLVLSPR